MSEITDTFVCHGCGAPYEIQSTECCYCGRQRPHSTLNDNPNTALCLQSIDLNELEIEDLLNELEIEDLLHEIKFLENQYQELKHSSIPLKIEYLNKKIAKLKGEN